jgi:hypothetical protein
MKMTETGKIVNVFNNEAMKTYMKSAGKVPRMNVGIRWM